MKKLLLFVLVLTNLSLTAQVPNYNFNCWNYFPGPPAYEEPCGWTSYNPLSSQGYPVFVYKTMDAHSDSIAIEVRTMGYNNPFPPFQPLVDVGYAQTGTNYQNGPNGFPFAQRPTMFSAWVKYLPQGVDSAQIKIKLTKWNPSAFPPQQDVANAIFYVSSNDSVYHCKTGNFVYLAPFTISGNPDTASVYISSSFQNNTTPGSVIRVDDIVFGNSCLTSVAEIASEPLPNLYPNPAADHISFSELPAGADRIKIFETTGKMVAAEVVNNSFSWIDIKSLTPGIYFFGVYDDNNKVISSGKFSVIR